LYVFGHFIGSFASDSCVLQQGTVAQEPTDATVPRVQKKAALIESGLFGHHYDLWKFQATAPAAV
jgi:hypothetical protein